MDTHEQTIVQKAGCRLCQETFAGLRIGDNAPQHTSTHTKNYCHGSGEPTEPRPRHPLPSDGH